MNDLDHAADSLAYLIRSGIMDVTPKPRGWMDKLVHPTLHCLMVLFVTLTLYTIFSKFVEGLTTVYTGIVR